MQSRSIYCLLLLTAVLAPLGAQCNQCKMSTSVVALGAGCNVPGTPALELLPAGTSVVLNVSSSHANAMSKIIVSLPGAQFNVAGCTVYLDPVAISMMIPFMTDSQGKASFVFDVPNVPALNGMTFILQSIEWSDGGPIEGDFVSNGLSVTLGCAGGEVGCSYWFWKWCWNFDEWPEACTPGQSFSTVFDNAFPGKSLLQVLEHGGGGLNSLGRQTVAALLNAETSGAAFGLAPAQVVSMFNAVVPEHPALYGPLKDFFEDLNSQGCCIH